MFSLILMVKITLKYEHLAQMFSASEFNEFKPRLKSPQNRFQLSAGLNLENLIQFEVEPTIFESRLKFKQRLKIFKFGLWISKMIIIKEILKLL